MNLRVTVSGLGPGEPMHMLVWGECPFCNEQMRPRAINGSRGRFFRRLLVVALGVGLYVGEHRCTANRAHLHRVPVARA